MSVEALRTTRKPPGLNGRHVLGVFLTFFAAVFVANGAMIYSALSTHTGLVANEPYRKGLHYNERIAADARQGRLGWVEDVGLSIDGRVSLALAESDGRPVRGLRIEGVLGRPSTNRHDVRLALAEKGSGPLRGASRASGGRQLDRDARSLHQRKPRRAHLPRAEASMAQALTQRAFAARRDWRRQMLRMPTGRATTTLAVENMHCGSCMRKVEATLAALPGVTSARANLSARRVTAVHGAAEVNPTDLVDALARAGYKAAELADDIADPARSSDRDFLKRLGVAGFAAANIMLLSVSVWAASAATCFRPCSRCSTGSPRSSRCRPSPTPASRSSVQPRRRCARVASTWTCRSRWA